MKSKILSAGDSILTVAAQQITGQIHQVSSGVNDNARSFFKSEVDIRFDAIKFATRYVSGDRYAGRDRVLQVASEFADFLMKASSDEDFLIRKNSLNIAIKHLCKPRSMIAVGRVLECAASFYLYTRSEK